MWYRPLTTIALFLFTLGLFGQKSPHPEYLMHYYFKASEPLKGSVLPPALLLNKKSLLGFLPISNTLGKENIQFHSQKQLGFDSIFSIEEPLTCSPFLAYKTEITNFEYAKFLSDSDFTMTHLGYNARQLYPDTNAWPLIAANEFAGIQDNPYRHYYFQSTYYQNYPVVGITYLQAKAYCDWLGLKVSEALAKDLQSQGIRYRLEIDLPTATEWMALFEACIVKPQKLYPKKLLAKQLFNAFGEENQGRELLNFIYSQPNKTYRTNFSGTLTNRGFPISNKHLFSTNIPESSPVFPPKPYGQIAHLLGNVSEWTSTPAWQHLYNNKSTILNTQGQLATNDYQLTAVFDLSHYLVDETALKNHNAIKGGSYLQELHYLDPMAIELKQINHSAAYLGFRPVMRFYREQK